MYACYHLVSTHDHHLEFIAHHLLSIKHTTPRPLVFDILPIPSVNYVCPNVELFNYHASKFQQEV